MEVLLVTDIHGGVENLKEIFSKEEFDAFLCAGDLSDAGRYSDYNKNLSDVLDVFGDSIGKAIPGNMDPEKKCVEKLEEYNRNLHKKKVSFSGFDAVGFGGGKTPFGTYFEPSGEQISKKISELYEDMSSDKKVAVVHQPPINTKLDLTNDGQNVGSKEIRELLEQKDFNLFLTGHIHEARGKDKIGETILVNPGPVLEGYYAKAKINDKIKVQLKEK